MFADNMRTNLRRRGRWCQHVARGSAIVLICLSSTTIANAQLLMPKAIGADDGSGNAEARRQYDIASQFGLEGHFEKALRAFAVLDAKHPEPQTTVAIAMCEYHLGRYARAYIDFRTALYSNKLIDKSREQAEDFAWRSEQKLGQIEITTMDPNVGVLVDGHGIEYDWEDKTYAAQSIPLYIAGTTEARIARSPQRSTYRIRIDPGNHNIDFWKNGHAFFSITPEIASGAVIKVDVPMETRSRPTATAPADFLNLHVIEWVQVDKETQPDASSNKRERFLLPALGIVGGPYATVLLLRAPAPNRAEQAALDAAPLLDTIPVRTH